LPHAVANRASCRIAEKTGFRLEGTEVGGYRDEHGVRWDSHVHGLLREGVVSRSSV
jgi:RimJ/RimL family protein N-acetyltransferase